MFNEEVFKERLLSELEPSGLNFELVDSLGDEGSGVVLPWTITNAFLADNPNEVDTKVSKLMAMQAAEDLTSLVFNGDMDSDDPLLHAIDGFHKLQAETTEWVVKLSVGGFTKKSGKDEVYCSLNLRILLEKATERVA